ncbi:MAG: alkaline phosphatase family protein, partial [Acidobacteria bacterium]|nr:alkaline phosphatase family protein [Acidobacteriota bacterium]
MKRLFLFSCLLGLLASPVASSPPVAGRQEPVSTRPAAAVPAARPALVVILVVDQMRADYIDQYGDTWTGGFRRLMNQGAWFTQAAFPYSATVTCVGHATIATGSLPHTHGIVGNSWYDRASGETVPCAADPSTRLGRYGEAPDKTGFRAHRLLVPTLADELRVQMPHAPRVV